VDAHALRRQGWTISAIARHLGHDRKTIRAYLTGGRVAGQRASMIEDPLGPYVGYLKQRLLDDPHVWATDLIPATAGLEVHDDPDGVTVLIQHPDPSRAWRGPDPGRAAGVRTHAQGAVSAWHTLPTDNMGPDLDPQTVPDLIAACLRLCRAAAPDTGPVALAVELGPTLFSVVRVGEFGHRTSAMLGMGSDGPVIVRPDETADPSALTSNARAAAEALAATLMRAINHR
jgi:hypothetical protein